LPDEEAGRSRNGRGRMAEKRCPRWSRWAQDHPAGEFGAAGTEGVGR